MTEKDTNFQKYEQMNIDNEEAPNPSNLLSKKNEINKNDSNNILLIIFILIIIILGIFYIYKFAYSSSLAEQINNFQNELNILIEKENHLQINNSKLIDIKNQILDKKNEINIEIEKIKEENKKLEEKNKIMNEGLKERQKAVKYFEEKIDKHKKEFTHLIFQQNNIRDKIKNCDERIEVYKSKIEALKNK